MLFLASKYLPFGFVGLPVSKINVFVCSVNAAPTFTSVNPDDCVPLCRRLYGEVNGRHPAVLYLRLCDLAKQTRLMKIVVTGNVTTRWPVVPSTNLLPMTTCFQLLSVRDHCSIAHCFTDVSASSHDLTIAMVWGQALPLDATYAFK
ncbi:hypothetical protein BKA70DRAFT_1235773 [Coprinopsis sp. MPI-PUGE-AT-0042]|nr:hypothetical protein BKA70DRAFT_1235773 [Coprinopsis sp. MPI-PUGE-AT-0042]